MEGGFDHVTKPLLKSEGENLSPNGRYLRIGNTVTALKCDFFSKLSDKLRSGLDPESPFRLDLSKNADLIKGEKEYYEKQFATLRSFEEVDSLDSPDVTHDEAQVYEEQAQHERAMNISNCANIFLLAFKMVMDLSQKYGLVHDRIRIVRFIRCHLKPYLFLSLNCDPFSFVLFLSEKMGPCFVWNDYIFMNCRYMLQ
ncbi:hypothetical protein F2P56_005964 [Juglans regia]|uniref:Metal tolerance protein C3 n=2 Tax=Juglans regia TaxID=51240 RepID=A0A2I4GYB1_JUGRE|nr:putative metal tolerance protein C3 [Juglans regia]XP_018848879.1 putative metal tolerance protein C3 [Juglans regia]KAF5474022.1 hypothetical protein F2P56_005964 [Juglans regia]